jgi:hypothetical protein
MLDVFLSLKALTSTKERFWDGSAICVTEEFRIKNKGTVLKK